MRSRPKSERYISLRLPRSRLGAHLSRRLGAARGDLQSGGEGQGRGRTRDDSDQQRWYCLRQANPGSKFQVRFNDTDRQFVAQYLVTSVQC